MCCFLALGLGNLDLLPAMLRSTGTFTLDSNLGFFWFCGPCGPTYTRLTPCVAAVTFTDENC